jgi:hypothetical protein
MTENTGSNSMIGNSNSNNSNTTAGNKQQPMWDERKSMGGDSNASSSLFQRRRGRPRKEEQAMRDEITERLLHFLETNYDMYRTASRADFYQAAAEALGDVEPAAVKVVFEKLIDSYIESRRRRAQPGRERAIAHWFGRLDHLVAGSRDFGGLLGPASSAIMAAGGPGAGGDMLYGSPGDLSMVGGMVGGGNGGNGQTGPGRKRSSTVLEAFIGSRGGVGGAGDGDEDLVVAMGDYDDSLSLGDATGTASTAAADGETHLAVQKAILRTHLAHLQATQQSLELQKKQVELQQAHLDALKEYRAQKLSLLKQSIDSKQSK